MKTAIFRKLSQAVPRKLPLETSRDHLPPPSFSHLSLIGVRNAGWATLAFGPTLCWSFQTPTASTAAKPQGTSTLWTKPKQTPSTPASRPRIPSKTSGFWTQDSWAEPCLQWPKRWETPTCGKVIPRPKATHSAGRLKSFSSAKSAVNRHKSELKTRRRTRP